MTKLRLRELKEIVKLGFETPRADACVIAALSPDILEKDLPGSLIGDCEFNIFLAKQKHLPL